MIKIGPTEGNKIKGIAWDDEYLSSNIKHVLVRIVDELDAWGITFDATREEDEFRLWLSGGSYQFAFLDVLKQYPAKYDKPEETGLDILKGLRKNSQRPGAPMIVITRLEKRLKEGFDFWPNEYLLSKELEIDPLTIEIIRILEQQAVRVDRGMVAVFDDTGGGEPSKNLVMALRQEFPLVFEFKRFPAPGLAAQMEWEVLRRCLGIVVMRAASGDEGGSPTRDDFLLKLGMALSQPRAQERCIQIGPDDGVERGVGLTPERLEKLMQQLEGLRRPIGA